MTPLPASGTMLHAGSLLPCYTTSCFADQINTLSDLEMFQEEDDVSITVSPDVIPPQNAGDNTVAAVTIHASANTDFTATISPVPNSGGHQHDTNRPTGHWQEQMTAPQNVYRGRTDSMGSVVLTYIPGDVGGEESIEVVTDSGWRGRKFVFVRVAGMAPLPRDSSKYKWDSNDGTHPNYLYAKPEFIAQLTQIANEYKTQTSVYLSFNDLSLISGGVFDYGPRSSPASFWTPPHNAHRKGTSADVNTGTIGIDGKSADLDVEQLDTIIKALSDAHKINCCRLEEDGSIHIECPKPSNTSQCTESTR